jgi:hypothetical protein
MVAGDDGALSGLERLATGSWRGIPSKSLIFGFSVSSSCDATLARFTSFPRLVKPIVPRLVSFYGSL